MPSAPPTAQRWLTAILILGASLRFFPIWFGLTYHYSRPDESEAVGHALAMLGGDLNPHFFHWPSLTFYLFAAVFAVVSGIRKLLLDDPVLTRDVAVLTGRMIVAIAGTLTIIPVFRLARRVWDPRAALAAAFFLAVAVLHVRDSHFAMTDVLMTLFVMLSLARLVSAFDAVSEEPSTGAPALRGFAVAGLLGGLATSTKYNAAAVVVSMMAAQLLLLARSSRTAWTLRAWTPLILFTAAAAAGFVARHAVRSPRRPRVPGRLPLRPDAPVGGPWRRRRSRLVRAPDALAALWLRRPDVRRGHRGNGHRAAPLAASGPGARRVRRRVSRRARQRPNGVLPVRDAAGAAGVRVRRHHGRRAGRGLLAPAWGSGRCRLPTLIVVLVIGAPSLVSSVWMDVLLARTDTRILAGHWLRAQLRPEHSVYDAGGTYVRLDLHGADYHQWIFDPRTQSFGDPDGKTPHWLVIAESPLRLYAQADPSIQRLAAERYTPVFVVRGTRTLDSAAVYDQQDAFFLPFSRFWDVERPGPTVTIYRRRE